VRVALHHAAAGLRDQVEGTTNRHGYETFPPIVAVDEDACDAIGGRLPRETGLIGLLVFLGDLDCDLESVDDLARGSVARS
jgi:hypothetical protein